jgi:hypothetical protein
MWAGRVADPETGIAVAVAVVALAQSMVPLHSLAATAGTDTAQ